MGRVPPAETRITHVAPVPLARGVHVVEVAPPVAEPLLDAIRVRGDGFGSFAAGVDAVKLAVRAGVIGSVGTGARAAIAPVKAARRDVQRRVASPVAYVGDRAVDAALVLSGASANAAHQACGQDGRAASSQGSPGLPTTQGPC